MTCFRCASSLPDDDIYCESCGLRLAPPAAPEREHEEAEISPNLAGVSDQGLRHSRNEDRFAIRSFGDTCALVVCDGVSNSRESYLAASVAAQTAADTLAVDGDMEAAITKAAMAAAALPARAAEDDPPSTTLVAALVSERKATVGWVGDSRAYWIADGRAKQLTSDHSWMNQVVSSGQFTAEVAAKLPQAHAITRWLGTDAGEAAAAEVRHVDLNGPGTLLLCTDGLWNYVPEEAQIGRLVVNGGRENALAVARRLVDFALAQGGHDNITAIVLHLD